jgi:hypothetical protein
MSNQHNHNNQSQTYSLNEGLETGDLSRLVDPRVTVDEYKSKIGRDEDIVVLSFKVQGKNPALDLVNFIEKSYDWILDADASSGELNDGNYLVFVECDRDESLPNNLVTMFNDLEKLTGNPTDTWILSYHKPHGIAKVDSDEISNLIPLTTDSYLAKQKSLKDDIDNLKLAAGVKVESKYTKTDFTERLQIAAGIR